MKVRATQTGYYNHRRYKEGEEFILKPVKGLDTNGKPKTFSAKEQFSEIWMELADEPKEEVEEEAAADEHPADEAQEAEGEQAEAPKAKRGGKAK